MTLPMPSSPTIVTIGTFDGVHLGHQWLLQQVIGRAQETSGRSVAVTFEPIPISILRPDLFKGRICTAEEKKRLLRASGLDDVKVVLFDTQLAARSPEDFLDDLTRETAMTELWVGNDFALGKNRAGDVNRIAEIGIDLGFSTVPLERLPTDGAPISSSRIRQAIEQGEIDEANNMLGRCFRVSGTVIHGAHLGRKIGYPTANFTPPIGIVSLADGIYASNAFLEGETTARPSMTYLGSRPTVAGVGRQIETHLFDFTGDLYGSLLTVDLVAKIRDDEHFDGIEPLVAQLAADEAVSRRILATSAPSLGLNQH